MTKLFASWVEGVYRRAGLVLLAIVALAAVSLAYSKAHFAIDTNPDGMLSEDLAYRRKGTEIATLFPQQPNSMVVVLDGPNADLVDRAAADLVAEIEARPDLFDSVFDPKGMAFFRQNGLLYLSRTDLAELVDRLAEAQPLIGRLWGDADLGGLLDVLRLAIEQSREGTAPIEIDFALGQVAAVVEGQAAGRPAFLSWQELLRGRVLEPKETRRIFVTQPVLDYGSLAPAGRPLDALARLEGELGLSERYGVLMRVTGPTALETEELRSIQRGMGLATMLSLGLVALMLGVGLGSFRLALATVTTLVFGLVFSLGVAFATVGRLNLISVAFAVLFVGLSVDFGIHYALRLREELARESSVTRAFGAAGEGVGPSLLLCSVAAAIGFFSFLPTDYVGLAELGLIAGLSMFVALATNLTLLPALLAFAPPRPAAPREPTPAAQAIHPVRRHARGIAIAAVAVAVVSIGIGSQARFDPDPFALRDPDSPSVRALFDLAVDRSTTPYKVVELAENLEAAEAIDRRLAGNPAVHAVVTLADFVPTDQDEKLEMLSTAALFLLPSLDGETPETHSTAAERREAVDTFLAELERSAASGDASAAQTRLRAAFRALAAGPGVSDASLAELETRLVGTLPERLTDLRRSLGAEPVALTDLPESIRVRWLAADGRARLEVIPKADLYGDDAALRAFVRAIKSELPAAAGMPIDIVEAGQAVVRSFLEATLLSSLLVVLLVAGILRRLRDTLLVLAPLLLAALVTIASTVVLGVPFNFANVIVLPLLFGLGVASGVHLVMRERHSGDVLETSTPRAVTFSALTTIGSFGSLAVVPHPGTASMGVLLTVAIVATLVSALGVLPALMEIFPARGAGSQGDPGS